ncbi:MAG TPA: hypothetical protein IAD13_00565 [Bacteroidetes bacterium]|nr:hypothetical protein [Candidatus Limimorpha avicola]
MMLSLSFSDVGRSKDKANVLSAMERRRLVLRWILEISYTLNYLDFG